MLGNKSYDLYDLEMEGVDQGWPVEFPERNGVCSFNRPQPSATVGQGVTWSKRSVSGLPAPWSTKAIPLSWRSSSASGDNQSDK